MRKDYYVYLHKLKIDNSVFYVGKGTRLRYLSKHGRSSKWYEIVKDNDWYYEIYKDNLTNKEALRIEVDLINEINPLANVQLKSTGIKLIDINEARKLYSYSEESSTGLIYNFNNNQGGKKKRLKGDPAGSYTKAGYYTVRLNSKSNIMAHRVVWAIVYGEDPGELIVDHIDGNRTNNKISNLRLVSYRENNRNTILKSNNKTGFKGVTLNNNLYNVSWVENGKPFQVNFSIRHYGNELAFALAKTFRIEKLKSLGIYSPRHDGSDKRDEILNKFSEDKIKEMMNNPSPKRLPSTGIKDIYLVKFNGVEHYKVKIGSHSRHFSTMKYGKERALKMAIEYKHYYLGEIYGPLFLGLQS